MQPSQKVNWIRKAMSGLGLECSISDNSGIVKLDVPGSGRRAPVLYRDEILFVLENAQFLKEYLESNQDVAFSKDQAHDSRSIKREQQKAATTAAKGLQALGFDNETIAKILTKQGA